MEQVNEFCKEMLKQFPYVSKERADKMYTAFSNQHETLEEYNEDLKTQIMTEYPEAAHLKKEDDISKFMNSNLCQFDEFKIHLSHYFNDLGVCMNKSDDALPECANKATDDFMINTHSFIKTFN